MDATRIDLYQLTSLVPHHAAGRSDDRVVMTFFSRRLPRNAHDKTPARGYLLWAGLERCLDHLEHARFSAKQIHALLDHPVLGHGLSHHPDLVARLQNWHFEGSVWAPPEGSVLYAGPAVRTDGTPLEVEGVRPAAYCPYLVVETDLLSGLTLEEILLVDGGGRPLIRVGELRAGWRLDGVLGDRRFSVTEIVVSDPVVALRVEDGELDLLRLFPAEGSSDASELPMEIVVEGAGEGALRSPALLQEMAELGEYLERIPDDDLRARQTISLADVVKEIHRALHGGDPASYVVPEDRALIAQELLLFEGSGTDDLEEQVDGDYTIGRISVRLPWHDAIRYVDFIDDVDARSKETLSEAGGVFLAGSLPLVTRAVKTVLYGVLESYGIALLVILALMILMLGDLRMGLYAMVPNLVPLVLTLGAMGWFGVPFDSFTMMTGGIALGLVVDDTIHFMHNFARYHAREGKVEVAVRETLTTAGRAITVTSLALGLGFLLFTFSSMSNLVAFGQVIAFAVGSALLADFLIAPALMALVVADRDAGA